LFILSPLVDFAQELLSKFGSVACVINASLIDSTLSEVGSINSAPNDLFD
jgi:hypothetical protein